MHKDNDDILPTKAGKTYSPPMNNDDVTTPAAYSPAFNQPRRDVMQVRDVSMKYFNLNISICFVFLKYFNGQKNKKKTKEHYTVYNFFKLYYCILLLLSFFVSFTFAAFILFSTCLI